MGRPQARVLDDGRRLCVLRVAVLEGDQAPNGNKGACSILYGACARAARAMGASDLITYTGADESGTSLRAAGWVDGGITNNDAEWSHDGRPRTAALFPVPKRRWLAPWSDLARRAA